MLVQEIGEYRESAEAYDGLADLVEMPQQEEKPDTTEETSGEDDSVVLPSVDFEILQENGPDIIAWLTLPDTAVNYPVTQAEDNDYYLRRDSDGNEDYRGCYFADADAIVSLANLSRNLDERSASFSRLNAIPAYT